MGLEDLEDQAHLRGKPRAKEQDKLFAGREFRKWCAEECTSKRRLNRTCSENYGQVQRGSPRANMKRIRLVLTASMDADRRHTEGMRANLSRIGKASNTSESPQQQQQQQQHKANFDFFHVQDRERTSTGVAGLSATPTPIPFALTCRISSETLSVAST